MRPGKGLMIFYQAVISSLCLTVWKWLCCNGWRGRVASNTYYPSAVNRRHKLSNMQDCTFYISECVCLFVCLFVCAIVLYHKLADVHIRVVPMSSKLTNLMRVQCSKYILPISSHLFPEYDSASLVPRPLSFSGGEQWRI